MQAESNIATEIDAIIRQAMAEYAAAKGIDPFEAPEETVIREESTPVEEPVTPIIPENSRSTLVEETTSRFSSAIWYDKIQEKNITLAGLGGIGSYVAFILSRMKPQQIILYDNDIIEAANMSGQLYGTNDIGKSKCSAIGDFIRSYSDFYAYMAMEERFTRTSQPTDIMICGFDNMAARETFFNSWKNHLTPENAENSLLIDGRLAAEGFQVLCIKGTDTYNIDRYEREFLFSDAEADETICSYKQTTFMANMIAAVMVNLFVNFCANQCDPLIPRDLPFYTEYTAETMFFKVIA